MKSKPEPILEEYSNGTKHWYLNNKLHREDGPAIEYADGTKEWWLNGEHYNSIAVWFHYMMEWKNGMLNTKARKEA